MVGTNEKLSALVGDGQCAEAANCQGRDRQCNLVALHLDPWEFFLFFY
jgi:hypothetical protein